MILLKSKQLKPDKWIHKNLNDDSQLFTRVHDVIADNIR